MTASTEQERVDFLAWIRTHEEEHGAVDEASAWAAWTARSLEQEARRAPVVAVPQGWKQGQPITEEMHAAACKVLFRAHGLDGTPQRMLDAMLAVAKGTGATHGQ